MTKALWIAAALFLAGAPALAEQSAEPAAEAAPAEQQCTTRQVADGFIPLFYEQGKVREAYETWVAPDYIQHNPHAENGREAAIAFLEAIFQQNPAHKMTVHRVLVDGDLFAVHLHGQSGPDDLGAAAVDILRVEGCRIVEHWDVTQKVPETSPNGNGMF